jgi:LysM repeat protein
MRRRLILTISVGLNVALLLLGGWLVAKRNARQLSSHGTNDSAAVSNIVHTRVVVRKQFFSWQELESADYRAYITNLRDIGCPDQTIRDIIVADVNQLYARKRSVEVATPDQQWWRYDPDTNIVQAANEKIAALDQERRALLTTLLGPNWESDDNVPSTGVTLNGPVLGELSPDTKRAVQEILARSQQRTEAYLDAQQKAGKAASPAELAKLGQQLRTELAQVLNPAQMEEFLLRYSQSAASLRERLRGIEVSPDEFRALFRTMDPLEQQFELVAGDTRATNAQQIALAKQMDDAMKSALGADRYQAYLTTLEPAYRDATALADENGGATLPEIRALYELNKATLQEQQRIRNDDTLLPEQKAAQLALVQQQQQAASDQILGIASPTPPTPPAPSQTYLYSSQETVDMIAARYGVSVSSILTANPTLNFHTLTPGTPIRIPIQAPASQ